jgi:hypothetical protein
LIVDQRRRRREDLELLELAQGSLILGDVTFSERDAPLRKPRFLGVAEHSTWLGEQDDRMLLHTYLRRCEPKSSRLAGPAFLIRS